MNERQMHRRRLQQRQTIIFGAASIILALLMLLASAWWTGILPFPFDKPFTAHAQSEESDVIPCLPEGTLSTNLEEITIDVYNASSRTGLAASVSSELTDLGVTVGKQGNWPGDTPTHPVIIYASSEALAPAYSLARVFSDATVLLDTTTQTGVLDVVLGSGFTDIASEEERANQEPGQPLTSPEGCSPVDK